MGLTRRGQVTAGGYAKGSDNDDTGPVSRRSASTRPATSSAGHGSNRPGPTRRRRQAVGAGDRRTPRRSRKLAVLDYATFLILYRAAFAPLGAGKPGFGTPATTRVQVGLVMRTLELKGL